MQLKPDALAAHLAQAGARDALAPLYVVSGDEPLLVIETADAIRAAARAAGYTEREVLHAAATRFDWSLLAAQSAGLSLFAQRRLLDVRLPGGKPGKTGAAALAAHAEAPVPDVLTLLTLPWVDLRKTQWAARLEARAVWIEVRKVEREQLPQWIGARLARQRQRAGAGALEFIADRVEGNLLAAQQEIAKLGLLCPPGELTLEQVTDAVLDVARYDPFGLQAAMLDGDAARVARVIDGLRAEDEPLPLVLWAVAEELRRLLRLRSEFERGGNLAGALRELRVRRDREAGLQAAARRLDAAAFARLLARCAEVDRLFKGLRAPRADTDPWLELTDIALTVATGAAAPAARPAARGPVPAARANTARPR